MNTVSPSPNPRSGTEALAHFCRDGLRCVSFTYVAWLLFGWLLSAVVYFGWRTAPLASILPNLLIYYLVALIHVVYRLKSGGKVNLLAPDIVFLLFYTLFHLGYVTLYGFGIAPYWSEAFFFEASIPESLFAVNLGLGAFLLGYEIMGSKGAAPAQQARVVRPSGIWCALGTALMALAVASHVGALSVVGIDYIQRYGYVAIQRIGQFTQYLPALILSMSGMAFVAGLVVHTTASALRNRRLFGSLTALLVTLLFIAVLLLEGERGGLFQVLVPLLLVRHYFVKRVRIRYLIGFALATLFVFTAIRAVRTIVFDPAKMLAEYEYQQRTGRFTWMDPFFEAGYSYVTLNITCHEVPSVEPYWYGVSWRDALIHTIPFVQGFATSRGWLTWTPGDWLKLTYFGTKASGRGYTITAEGYINFGYPGVIAEVMLFGVFIRWLTVRFARNPSARWAFIFMGCFGPCIEVIRNQVNGISHTIAYVFVAAWILNVLLGDEVEPADEAGQTPLPSERLALFESTERGLS